MEYDDRITEVPEDRKAYENAACVLTSANTIPPESNDDNNNTVTEGQR